MRPRFGDAYGIHTDDEGMLPWSWADERLSASRNYWIASTGADGRPYVSPVWGVWIDDSVVWGSSARSLKARNLEGNPAAAVHLESGDEAVILEGDAEIIRLDDRIADAYRPKYGWRPNPAEQEDERWFRLRPTNALAWYERDYPKTATRFKFD